MTVQLSAQLAELLSEVVKKHCPHLTSLLDSHGHIELTDSQRDELQGAAGDEFLATGLEENDEPNKRGLLLEDLIGRLRRP